MGKRAFSVASPLLWNNLPDNIRDIYSSNFGGFQKEIQNSFICGIFWMGLRVSALSTLSCRIDRKPKHAHVAYTR